MKRARTRQPAIQSPRNQANRSRGRWGEDVASSMYQRLGYEIVDRNWRSPTGELDLVLRHGEIFVFSEVKARRNDDFGPASAAVGATKQGRIRKLAIEWLRAHELRAESIRFDVVAITGTEVELIEDAF
jgi:putative endonuclease